jgi:hypothetical protein
MSNTLGDLCDLFGSTRDRHVSVIAEPRRGVHHPLGYLTVERVGTLRPQLQPPYLSGAVRFVESYTDYDNSGIYCDNLIPQIPALLSTTFEIALYLPFMTRIITKEILGTCTISDIMTWTSDIFSQYHQRSLATPEEQLHFTNGYAIPSNTVVGNIKFNFNQRFYILSRSSVADQFHGAYTRLMHGYYTIRKQSFVTADGPISMPIHSDFGNRSVSSASPAVTKPNRYLLTVCTL